MRLFHRVAFLEDHTKELKLGMKQVEKTSFILYLCVQFQIQNSLERTLKSEDRIHVLPRKSYITSLSTERCSTATSGVYSATERDCSNSTEQSSRDPRLGPPEEERKIETLPEEY